MFCAKCGSKTDENNKFCTTCGAAKGYPIRHNNVPSYEPGISAANPTKKCFKIIVSCVLVVILAVVGLFYLVGMPAIFDGHDDLDEVLQLSGDVAVEEGIDVEEAEPDNSEGITVQEETEPAGVEETTVHEETELFAATEDGANEALTV